MTYDDAIKFLAANPWILAACALITLWPVIRGTFKIYRRVELWVFSKIEPATHVAEVAAAQPSYYVATLTTYAFYLGLLAVVINAVGRSLEALPIIDGLNGTSIARFLLGWLYINCALLFGMIVSIILRLGFDVIRVIESNKP